MANEIFGQGRQRRRIPESFAKDKDAADYLASLEAHRPNLIPTGGRIKWGISGLPTGFLTCDGSAISRTTYAGLFMVVGTTFGAGDGTTTFNIPTDSGFIIKF